MVQTKKFSEFADADLTDSDNELVGFGNGLNIRTLKQTTWTTATRPSPPFNGLMGFNSDLSVWEYYDADTDDWVQFATSDVPSNLSWNEITTTSATMVPDNGYVTNNVGQVVLTLPATCEFGRSVAVCGVGSGGWQISFNTGQNVVLGSQVATTSTGTIASVNQFDQIELLCVVENTTFIARNIFGNLTVT